LLRRKRLFDNSADSTFYIAESTSSLVVVLACKFDFRVIKFGLALIEDVPLL
jgi:hypothetical protein